MRKLLLILPCLLLAFFACSPEKRITTAESAEWQAHLHLDSAINYIDLKYYDHAIIQLKMAEKLLPLIENDSLGYRTCLYLGWMNEQAGAHQTALDYEQTAQIYAEATKNQHYIVNTMIHQVKTLNNMGRTKDGRFINETAISRFDSLEQEQQARLLCNEAYYLMTDDSLQQAEHTAYQAAMMAEDSTTVADALSLLSRIMLQKGDEQQAQVLMQMIPETENLNIRYNQLTNKSELEESRGNYQEALYAQKQLKQISDSINRQQSQLDISRLQTEFDLQWHQRRSAERSFKMSLVIIFMLLTMGGITYVYFRRQQMHHRDFQLRISEVRQDLNQLLVMRNTRLEDLKQALDSRMDEIERLKTKLTVGFAEDEMYLQIKELKTGIDVLDDILNHKNISQYGRNEQQAVLRALWMADRPLAALIDDPDITLTPKETFFCIMEYYGISDDQKIDLFCCTEQAIRSTKSRLSKKFDLKQLHQ